MAMTLASVQRRVRNDDPGVLDQVELTCTSATAREFVCSRVLWEDDRYGRVVETVELPATRRVVHVEVPAERTPAGETRWQPLEVLPGAASDAAHCLIALIHELADDLHAQRAPARDDAPVYADAEETPYRGLV